MLFTYLELWGSTPTPLPEDEGGAGRQRQLEGRSPEGTSAGSSTSKRSHESQGQNSIEADFMGARWGPYSGVRYM